MARRRYRYDRDSVYGEQVEQRIIEDRELDRKERDVVGWSRWDLACLGAGGEENLIKEINERKRQETLEDLAKRIAAVKYKIKEGAEDPEPYEERLAQCSDEIEEIRSRCVGHIYKRDGSVEEIPDEEKFWKRSSYLRDEKNRIQRKLLRIEEVRAGYYDRKLEELTARKKRLEGVEDDGYSKENEVQSRLGETPQEDQRAGYPLL